MRAVSNEMKGVTILELRGSDIVNAGKENAIVMIRKTFERAIENVPSIIFVDEIDTMIPKREGATEAGAQITGEMLEQIDGIKKATGVVLIAATNRPEALDAAILRAGRFDKMIFVRPPNAEERASLFRIYLKNVPVAKDIDFDKLGVESDGFTGADIANVLQAGENKRARNHRKDGRRDPDIPRQRGIDTAQPQAFCTEPRGQRLPHLPRKVRPEIKKEKSVTCFSVSRIRSAA